MFNTQIGLLEEENGDNIIIYLTQVLHQVLSFMNTLHILKAKLLSVANTSKARFRKDYRFIHINTTECHPQIVTHPGTNELNVD